MLDFLSFLFSLYLGTLSELSLHGMDVYWRDGVLSSMVQGLILQVEWFGRRQQRRSKNSAKAHLFHLHTPMSTTCIFHSAGILPLTTMDINTPTNKNVRAQRSKGGLWSCPNLYQSKSELKWRRSAGLSGTTAVEADYLMRKQHLHLGSRSFCLFTFITLKRLMYIHKMRITIDIDLKHELIRWIKQYHVYFYPHWASIYILRASKSHPEIVPKCLIDKINAIRLTLYNLGRFRPLHSDLKINQIRIRPLL